jgi:glycine/D-amino acid oxidase-like deaminating enzyme/nitrite reductase/ring-hydroxylating ferredoxin subunit
VSNYNIACDLTYKPGYLFSETEEETEELKKIKAANDKVFVLTEWSETIPVPIPFDKALKVDFQGQLHATKYLAGLAKAFESLGGVILQHCTVNDVKEEEHISASIALGTIKTKHAVYATHIPPGLNIFSARCAPYRSYAMAFTLKSGSYPEGLAYDCKDPYHYFRTHTIDGIKYVIAGGFDHKTGHNDNTEHVFTELEAYLRHYYDIDAIPFKRSSQYYNSIDGLPYIGLMPGSENVYVATGYGGNGMVLGSLAAKTICSILHNEPTPYEELFDPSRIKMIAGFSAFVKENADVVSQFIGGQFSYEHISQLAELAPGEAAIAEWEGRKVALYKDEHGKVYAVDPVCPHAKCIVAWNSAETSWDCPCHGSRFAPDGTLLTGPATKGLFPIKK